MTRQNLCPVSELSQLQCREFSLTRAGQEIPCFVVCWNNTYRAYINSCPHTGVSLNWQANEFLDFDKQYIQCSMHGAIFRIEDGYCIRGPCLGARLQAINLILDEGNLVYDDKISRP